MKKTISLLLFLVWIASGLFCEEIYNGDRPPSQNEGENIVPEDDSDMDEEFFYNGDRPSDKKLKNFNLLFNEGASYGQITRIEKLSDRSNFVRETFLAGAFINIQTINLWKLDFTLQIDAYYPFYNAFNGMHQYPKNIILYAFDGYLGIYKRFDFLKIINISISLGMHYMYQLTDEYHMNYLGLGTLNSIEFPISKHWTIINSYFFSYDDANLGSNKLVQPFSASYQYHIDFGVRYSKKLSNNYSYIKKD